MRITNYSAWTKLIPLACIISFTFIQGGDAQNVSTSASPADQSLNHGLAHEQQLNSLLEIVATDQQRREMARQLHISLETKLAPELRNTIIPQEQRSLAAQVSNVNTPDDLHSLFLKFQNQGVAPSAMLPVVESSVVTVLQVTETKAPAFAIKAIPGGPDSLTQLSSCPSVYQTLSGKVRNSSPKLAELARGVGRVVVVETGKAPSNKGTAFVMNQAEGLVVTACHVVDAIADFEPGTGKWVMPKKSAPSAVVSIDFGDMTDYVPALEFNVTKVSYVPTVTGCDGAILSVATTNDKGGSLPAQLPLASQEPIVSAAHPLDVVSIGYPDLINLTGTTTDTENYFQCVSHAAANTTKFLFGGDVTSDEPMGGYHLQTHVLPTTGGQSGSPIIDVSDPNKPNVIGIHICCTVGTAQIATGPVCQRRNEPFMEESVSVIDLIKLFDGSQKALAASVEGGSSAMTREHEECIRE